MRGKNRRACIGGRSGHGFGGWSSLESGHRLSDSDAGQQKSSEHCAMHACHILEFEWNSIVTKTAAVVISEASLVESRASPPGHHGAGRARGPSLHRISPHHALAELELRLGRDRKSAPIAKRLGGNLDSRRRLLPLVFAALHHSDHPPPQIWIKIVRASDLFGRPRLLHEVFENLIEHC